MYKKISFFRVIIAVAMVGISAGIIFFSEGFFGAHPAYAGTGDVLSGYAWSETIGWISFNCTTDPGGCGSSNYGVTVDGSGNFSGYAWSENVGWISFNAADVAGCPSGSCPPVLNLSTQQVSGWARACAGSPNGDCTGGSGPNANSGGWDGWIKLQENILSPSYGVTYNAASKQFQGYAWGSDKVGWVSFNCSDPGTGGCGANGAPPNYYVGGIINTAPTVSGLTADPPSSATYCGGAAQHFSWTFSDPDGDTQSAYQLQVAHNINFSSIQFDSGKVTTPSTSIFVPVSASPAPNQLAFNATYYWRVRVFDSGGLSGSANGPSSFSTPKHPYPQAAFTWSPTSPSVGQITFFTDQTIFAPSSTSHAWQWTIPNATYVSSTTSTSQNPQVKFTSPQPSNSVVLQASDDVGSCTATNNVASKPPLPQFKEVQPQ